MTYQAKKYWEERLGKNFSLSTAGHQGFSERYNSYMYRLKERALEKALRCYGISVEGRSVLDVGCGSGFFVDYYLRNKAAVTGIDITDISVRILGAKFPSCIFFRADISAPDIRLKETFSIVNAFDVFYHIVDDDAFERAIENIGARCKHNSWVLLTDTFDPEKSAGEHVRYRDLGTYRTAFSKAGIDIIGIVPVFRMIGMGVSPLVRNKLVKMVLGRIIESFAWFSYILDMAYCPTKSSLMMLLVCKKI